MERREFVKQMMLGLAAGWAAGKLSWPLPAGAENLELRLAVLADAHLKDGNDRRPEARSLARAVAEINSLTPAPHVVLLAGDLVHRGRPEALDLGREILSDLPAATWAVRGEGDCGPGGSAPWVRRFGEAQFSRPYRGVHFLGLDTVLCPTSRGPVFELGQDQRQALAQELARLAPTTALIILSHAPLAPIFHPWQQWTGDAPDIMPLLARFRQVVCLHGHVHGTGVRDQGPGIRREIPSIPLEKGGIAASPRLGKEEWSGNPSLSKGDLEGFSGAGNNFHDFEICQGRTTNRLFHLSLPATAWPRPQAVQGTPAVVRPGIGPCGCGWMLLTLASGAWRFKANLWQA